VKTCPTCGPTQSADAFYQDRSKADGLTPALGSGSAGMGGMGGGGGGIVDINFIVDGQKLATVISNDIITMLQQKKLSVCELAPSVIVKYIAWGYEATLVVSGPDDPGGRAQLSQPVRRNGTASHAGSRRGPERDHGP
jgi:hypothetical protein